MLKKRKGFTLFEAIISVAIIAVSSITILQVFYTSGNLNRRASDLDIANSILTRAMDVSKNVENETAFFVNDEIFDNMVVIDEGIKDVVIREVYYDKDWNDLEGSFGTVPDNTKFIARYEYKPEEVFYDDTAYNGFNFKLGDDSYEVDTWETIGTLYTIDATVTIIQESQIIDSVGDLSSPILTTLSSSKYIGNDKK